MNPTGKPPEVAQPKRLKICLINPRSRPSYWTFDFASPFFRLGRKRQYTMANGALVGVAALVPDEHEVVLLDENVEEIEFEKLREFDVIGVTGMIVQAQRMKEILIQLQSLPALIVIGGAFVTVSEASFEALADVRFIGEAEETWPQFLNDFASGAPIQTRYEQKEKTDMTKVPVPRFDLLPKSRFSTAPVQFSRGCPFLCEFCDIITTFGRRPRVKQPAQILRELEAVVACGFRDCFLVDDNFIGNKLEAKKLLRSIIEWQQAKGYPLVLTTEASINLANDAEFIDLMVKANFRSVFIGIETPRIESLEETRKLQNVHGDSLLSKLDRIRKAGLVVTGGFIVGFDNDDERIFDEQFEFIQASGITNLSISVLTALPTTPLYDRLKREGRLDYGDPEIIYLPKQMSREQLKAGFHELVDRIYQPEAFFDRAFDGLAKQNSVATKDVRVRAAKRVAVRSVAGATARAMKLIYVFTINGSLRRHLRVAAQVVKRNTELRAKGFSYEDLVNLWIYYWHFSQVTQQIKGTDFGTVPTPERITVTQTAHPDAPHHHTATAEMHSSR